MSRRPAAAVVAALILLSACSASPTPSASSSSQSTPTATPFGTTVPSGSPSGSPIESATAPASASDAPTVAPTGTPTAPPSGCRAGNRVAAGAQESFTTVPDAGHAAALTFDMGGRLDPGIDILAFLIANGVCATIFPTGALAATAEGQEVLAIVRAHPELFEVGNHTMHHCDLIRGGGGSPSKAPCQGVVPTADFIRSELVDAAAIIEQYSGQAPIPYWRPPYASVNQAVRDAAASVGYTKTFMWDVDTVDWKPIADGGPSAEQIATKVIANAGDGSIVLMHLGGYETLEALAIMVPGLRDRGFLLTSLSDLLS
jgi:peptidoglycan/xylan/chitin deacetylase (PgdA/CDA1 family)